MKTEIQSTRKLRKGSIQEDTISTLESAGVRVFTISELTKILGIKKSYARVIIHRLMKHHWLARIKRGAYQLIPSEYGAGADVPTPSDPFLIASKLSHPYSISYYSAAFLHGLTSQIPSTVFISSPQKHHLKDNKRYRFKFIYVPSRMLRFGCKIMNYRGIDIIVTDIERTLIDVVDKPNYAGGLPIVFEIITKAKKKTSLERLYEYTHRYNKISLVQRLGYLTELAGYRWSTSLQKRFRNRIVYTKNYLDPSIKSKKFVHYAKKWNLVVNVPLAYLLGEGGIK